MGRTLPLRTSISVLLFLAFTTAGAALVFVDLRHEEEAVRAAASRRGILGGGLLAVAVQEDYEAGRVEEVARTIDALRDDSDLLFGALVGPGDTIEFSTSPGDEGRTLAEVAPEIAGIEFDEPSANEAQVLGPRRLLFRFPIHRTGTDPALSEPIVTLLLTYDISRAVASAHAETLQFAPTIFLLGLVFAGALWLLLDRIITRPVSEVVAKARRIAPDSGRSERRPGPPNELVQLSVAVDDVAKRISRWQREVRVQQEFRQNIEEIGKIGGWEVDLGSGRMRWTERIFGLFDLPPGREPDREAVFALFDPPARRRLRSAVREAIENRRAFDLTLPAVTAGKRRRWMGIQGRPVLEGGEVVRLIGTVQDLTERVESEHRLKELHDQLRSVTAQLPGMLFRRVSDSQGHLRTLYLSGRLLDTLGLQGGEVIGQIDEIMRAVHPDDRDELIAALMATRALGEKGSIEVRALAPDGRVLWLEAIWRVTRVGKDEVVINGIVLDVTARRDLEAQLRQSQKLEAVGELTGGIAHDFNNLLTVIRANAETLAAQLPDGSLRPELEDLLKATDGGIQLVKGLLGFSRRAELRLSPLNLLSIIRPITRMLERVLPSNIELELDAAEAPDRVLADVGAVQQILLNLATNARDAMPEGGKLTIRMSELEVLPEHLAAHPWIVGERLASIEVSDTGAGMTSAVAERIFEPFYTTKGQGRGTGLGLSMVHGLIKQHGGLVDVRTVPGEGSTFRIGLPLASEREEDRPVLADPGLLDQRDRTARILLVEDQETLRRTTKRVLERLGHTVDVAGDGAEALALFEERGGAYDLVVTDLAMPRLGGIGLYQAIRRTDEKVRFLFTSGYTEREVAREGEIPAGEEFIPKPWTLLEITDRIRLVLERSTS